MAMMSKKIKSMITVGIGAGIIFYGYNVYIGDYRLYTRHVIPMIHQLYPNAEKAHILAVKACRYNLVPRIKQDKEIQSYLNSKVWNIEFNNPVGLAAGFDKDGEAITGLSWFGFGFLEVGTITPEPQKGNFPPRVFRLPLDRAVINRYGFPNLGHQEMEKNLERQKPIIQERDIIVGVNLGANRNTKDNVIDYLKGLQKFYKNQQVKYFVINISCPNTPNSKHLEQEDQLDRLLDIVLKEKKLLEQQNQIKKPLLLKLSPYHHESEHLKSLAKILKKYSIENKTHSQIDGMIISNTTTERPSTLKSPPELIRETGGLSGPPLRDISTRMIRKMYQLTDGKIPIIGVGGIETGMDAYEKIKAGASLVQIYTSMVYFGPPIVREIKYELAYLLAQDGYRNVSEAIGVDSKKSDSELKKVLDDLTKKMAIGN